MCATASAALAAAIAPAASWHLVYRAPVNSEIQGITAPGPDSGWAIAARYATNDDLIGFFYLHWNGVSWLRVNIPAAAGFFPEQIQASSPSNVWIFGYRPADLTGEALVYNGHGWKALRGAPWPGEPLAPAVVATSRDVWLVSQIGCLAPGCTTVLQNWDGSAWPSYSIAGQLELAGGGANPWLVGLAPTGPAGHVTDVEAVYRWNGHSWQHFSAPGRAAAGIVGVASPSGRLWVVTESRRRGPWTLYERVGTAWSRLTTLSGFYSITGLTSAVYDGRNGFWSLPFHWTGTRWIRTMPNFPNRPWWFNSFWYDNAAPVPGSSSVWAVILANVSRISGTQQSAIAVYGQKP